SSAGTGGRSAATSCSPRGRATAGTCTSRSRRSEICPWSVVRGPLQRQQQAPASAADSGPQATDHGQRTTDKLMSRTTLCVLTAAGLAVLSLGVMLARRQALGDEVKAPVGPGTFKVTLVARGKSGGEARLVTACPLDFKRQHVSNEHCQSKE